MRAIDKSLFVVITFQRGRMLTGASEIIDALNTGAAVASRAAAEERAQARRAEQRADNLELRRVHRTNAEAAMRAMVVDDDDSSDAIPEGSAVQFDYEFRVMSIEEWEMAAERDYFEMENRDIAAAIAPLRISPSMVSDLASLSAEIERRRHGVPGLKLVLRGSAAERARQKEDSDVYGHPAYRAAKALISRVIKNRANLVPFSAGSF